MLQFCESFLRLWHEKFGMEREFPAAVPRKMVKKLAQPWKRKGEAVLETALLSLCGRGPYRARKFTARSGAAFAGQRLPTKQEETSPHPPGLGVSRRRWLGDNSRSQPTPIAPPVAGRHEPGHQGLGPLLARKAQTPGGAAPRVQAPTT